MEQTRHIQEGRSDAYLILQDAQHATEQVQPGQEAPDVDAYIIRNNASDLIAAHPDRDPRNHVVAQNTPYSEMAFTSSARHLTEQPGPYRNDFQRLYDRTMQTHKMGVSPGDDIGRSYVNQINHTIEDVLFEGLFLSQPDVLEAQNQRPFHELLSDHFTSTIVNEESTLLFHPQITPCDLRNVETYSYIPSDQFELANVLSDQVEKFLRFNQIVDPLTAQIEGLILSERSTNAGNRDAINETTTQALSQIRSQLFLLVFLPMFNLQTWKLINDDDPETEGVQNTKVKTFEDIRKTLILFKGLLSDEEMQKAEDIIDALELEWLNPAYHNVSNDLIRNSRRARFCTNAIDKWHDFSKELSEKPNTEATFANLKDTMESVRKDLITKLGKFVEAAGIYMPENEPLNQELHWQPNYHYKEGYEQRIHAAVFGTVDEYDTLYLVSIHRDERPQRDVHGHIIQDSSSRIEMDLSIPQPNDLISPPDHVAPYLGELQEALSYLSEMNTHIAKEYKDRVIEQLFANKEAKEEESNTLLVGATETTNPQYLIKPPSRERLSGLLAEQHRQLTTYRLGNQIGEIACFTDSTWLDFEKALYSLDASKASDTANDPYYNGMEGLYVDWYPENFFNLRTFILCYLTGWQKNGEPLELARGITEFYFRLLNDIYKPLSYHVTGLSLDGAEIQANQTWKEWMITFHNIFSEHKDSLQTLLDKNLIGDRDKTLYQTRLDYLSNFFASYAEPEDPAHTEAPMAQQVHDRLEKAQEILGYGQTVLAIPQDLAEALSLWTEYQNTMSDFEQANSSLDPDKSLAILVRSFVEGDLDLEYFLQKLASLNQEASLLHQRTLWNNETNQTGLVYKIQALEKQALTKLREDDALFIVNRLRTALYHLELTYQHEMARDTAVRKDFVQTAGSVLTYWQKSLITGWPSNTKQDNDGLNYEIDNSKKNKIIYFTPEAFIESIQGSGLTFALGEDGISSGYHDDPNRIVEYLTYFFTDYHNGYYREFCPINKYRDTEGNEIYAIRDHEALDKLIYTLQFLEGVANEKLADPSKKYEAEEDDQLETMAYICRSLSKNLIQALRAHPFEELWTFDVRDYATDPKDSRTVPNTILGHEHSLSRNNPFEDYQFSVQNTFATANSKPTEFLKEDDGHFDLSNILARHKDSRTPLVEPSEILSVFNDLTNNLPVAEKRIAFIQALHQLPAQDMLYILGRLVEAHQGEFTSNYKQELVEITQGIYEIGLVEELKKVIAYLGASQESKSNILLSEKAQIFVDKLSSSETLWVQGYISSLVAATERERLEYNEVFMQKVWQDHLDEVIFNLDSDTRDELTQSLFDQIYFRPHNTHGQSYQEQLASFDENKALALMAQLETYNSHTITKALKKSWITLNNKLYYEDTYNTDFTWTENLYMSWRLQQELTGTPSQEGLEEIKQQLLHASQKGIAEGIIRDQYKHKLQFNPQRIDSFLDRHFNQLERLKPTGDVLSEEDMGLIDNINAEIIKQKEFLYRSNCFALNQFNDEIVDQWIKYSSLEEGNLVTHGLKSDGLRHFWTYMENLVPIHESHPDFVLKTDIEVVKEIDAQLYKDIIGEDVVAVADDASLDFVFDPQTTLLIRDILHEVERELDKAIDRGVPNLENRRATLKIISKALTGVFNADNPKEVKRHSRFNPNRNNFTPTFVPKGLREVFRFSNIEATIAHQGSAYERYDWLNAAQTIDPDFQDIFQTDFLSARAKRHLEDYLGNMGEDIANNRNISFIQAEAMNHWNDPVALMMARIHLGELKRQALAIKTQTSDEIDLTPENLEAAFDRVLEQIDYRLSQHKAEALCVKASDYLYTSLPNEDLRTVFVSKYIHPSDLLDDYEALLEIRNQMLPVREVLENNLQEPHADEERNNEIIANLDTTLRLIEAFTHTVPEEYKSMAFASIIQDQVAFFAKISPTLTPYLTAFEESLIQEDMLNPQGSAALIQTSQELGLNDMRLAKLFLARLINLAHNNKHRVVADRMKQLFMNRYYLLQIRSKKSDSQYEQALFVLETDHLKLPDEFTTVAYELERLGCSSHNLAVLATELQARCVKTYTQSRDQGVVEDFDEELLITLENLSLEDRKEALISIMKINDAFLNLNEHPFTISLLYTTLRMEKELMRTEDVRANFTMANHVTDELDMIAQLTPSLEVLAQNMYDLLFHRGNNPFKEQKQVRAIQDHMETLTAHETDLVKYFLEEILDGFPEPTNMNYVTEIPLWDSLKQVYTFLV